MSYIKTSLLVLVCAVILNMIPVWFKGAENIPPVLGFVAPGWEPVREVYRQLFADGDDKGSSLCVYYKGKPVVDLRGGFANERELWPWQENTITRLFSTTKGLSAIVIAVLVDRGLMKYQDLVTIYWPEFGVHGKENVTVEMLLSHQTGLVTISDESYSIWDEINDVDKVGRLLADEKPRWKIGTGIGYHGVTIGLYMDQLVRRVDPKHRSLPQFFHEEIAEPFGIDIQFALKDSEVYRSTVYDMLPMKFKYIPKMLSLFLRMYLYDTFDDGSVDYMKVASTYDDKSISPIWFRSRPDIHQLWNPSGFAYGNAHGLAKLFGIAANGGSLHDKKLLSPFMVDLQAEGVKSGWDKCLKVELTYGKGYTIMQSPKGTPMFGAPGFGGQMGYADPKHKLGIGFTSNYLSLTGLKGHRYNKLEDAIYRSLNDLKQH